MPQMDKKTSNSFIKNFILSIGNTISRWFKSYKSCYRRSPWYKKILIVIATFIVCVLLYFTMVDNNFLWLFGKSPGIKSISKPMQSMSSEIYSADGKMIGTYFKENRIPVKYADINPMLFKVLIATEDVRFYHHFGIDIKGLFSAAISVLHGQPRGASTITQQLVKNMFKMRSQYSTGLLGYIPGVKILIMKSKEWISAVKIEMFYSKKQILEMYLNTVDFGSNAYGIKTAAKTYFNTTPKNLKIEQCAVLVGMLKAITAYSPVLNPKNSLKRRNIVLENLYKNNIIGEAQYDSIRQLPLKLNYNVSTNYDGVALYFRDAVEQSLSQWCKENDMDLYSDGLKIYTSLNSRMQQYAEDAVKKQMKQVQANFKSHWGRENPWRDEKGNEIPGFIEGIARTTDVYKSLRERYPDNMDSVNYFMNKKHKLKLFDYVKGYKEMYMSSMDSISYMQKFMHCGFIAMEPQTGLVRAWVGDVDFNTWKYDKVLAKRQPGSTFKLFDYSAAFNRGMSPCDEWKDQYIDWDVIDEDGKPDKWIPHNANGFFTGETMTLKAAFTRSVNSIAVQVAKTIGIDNIIKTAYAMGVKTPLKNTPATCLGASDLSLLELVDSYCTAINDGVQNDPVLVTKITDRDGKVLYEYKPKPKQAISYETAFLMVQMLLGGLTEPGSTVQALWAFNLFKYGTDFGGKTGTSSNHSDAWFVGVTPKLVGGAWVGGEHRSIHFRSGALGQGSRTALPIYGYFMEKVMADPSLSMYRGKFPGPKETITKNYRCQTPYKPKVVADSTSITNDTISSISGEGTKGKNHHKAGNNADEIFEE